MRNNKLALCITAILLFTILSAFVYAQDSAAQEPTSATPIKTYVNDYAGIFTPEETQKITAIAEEIYNSGKGQYAVVTVKTTGDMGIYDYSLKVAQGKLGDTEKNNGLLLLIAVEDRDYFFQVGKGMEGTFNDAKIGRIGRTYIVPNFKNEEYGKGVIETSDAIRFILLNGTDPDAMLQSEDDSYMTGIYIWIALIIIYVAVIIIVNIVRYKEQKKKGKYFNAAKGASGIFWGGGGGFGGGGWGGGSSGGGFGGGGFSGGGAGGGW